MKLRQSASRLRQTTRDDKKCPGEQGLTSLSTHKVTEVRRWDGQENEENRHLPIFFSFTKTSDPQPNGLCRGPHPEGNFSRAGWLFNQRLPALRQFRKEKRRANPTAPAAPEPDVKLRGAALAAAIFSPGKTPPSRPSHRSH